MRPQCDPEGAELSHLLEACRLSDRSILEIGCGAGQLTWQYADLPRRAVGIDPAASELRLAQSHPVPAPQAAFIQANGEALPFASQAFDVALFASSL